METQWVLTPDQLLSTTRSVRKRLDFDRPVSDEVVRECVALSMMAPAGSNVPRTRFVVVRDAEVRGALADLYRSVYRELYLPITGSPASQPPSSDQARLSESVAYLAEHLQDCPVLVIACLAGVRVDGELASAATSMLGQTGPAMWSFMLAARARGLGTCWTTMHLFREREAAEILGIPFDSVQQVCLSPLAYTRGLEFKPVDRGDPEKFIHWDGWDASKPLPPPYRPLVKPA